MTAPSDNPGVKFPPPLLYAAAVIGGIFLDHRWFLPIGSGMWREVVGSALVGLWAVLTATSVGRFLLARTSILPMRPASTFIQSGPYRFTRNPMYVGLALLTISFGLFFNTYWPIVLLVPVLLLIQRFVILPEERYLRRRFGADYEAYTRKVRRWL